MKRHVIIGNSHAGTTAIEWLRKVNDQDEVILISKEDCPAYSPALTTYYLSGKMPYDGMFYVDETFYPRHKVQTMRGAEKALVRLEPAARTVHLADGSSVQYDNLLIATGSRSVIPPLEGANLPGVYSLWSAEDAHRINDAIANAQRVAVVGGGLIGIQSVNAMLARKKKITQIEMLGHLMPAAMDADGGKIIEAKCRQLGIDLRLNTRLEKIEERGAAKVLTLSDGSQVEADLAIMAVGVAPNIPFVEGSGLRVDRGIIIDEYSRTNVDGIYAAGDCAASVDQISGEMRVFAIIPAAAEHGRVAGLNMGGLTTERLRNIGLNTFTPVGLPCGSVGSLNETGRDSIITVNSGGNFRKLIFEGSRLVGAVLIGKPLDEGGLLASIIEMRRDDPQLRKELITDKGSMTYIRLVAEENGLLQEVGAAGGNHR